MAQRAHLIPALAGDAQWYKDALIYQLHVRAFYDSNQDGMGDFRGLTQKLDYLEDLGVTALWLLPFYPSPLKDDGYDIADYTGVHPNYGTLADFRQFLREAHRRGLQVITELVLNHTSDQHPWFQRSRRAPVGSPARDFYVWSDTPDRYRETRIIFKDFEHSNWAWDPLARSYYWHRFYSHQPDLNFDNPEVHKAVLQALDFWLEMGVDGLRLDAVPYLYEREGSNCENLPETHTFLRKLRAHVDAKYANRMLLAEANQWPEDAVAYFGLGDECHMAFHFPLMPRMFMANRMENRYPILDILSQTPAIPDTAQWALFLRNHDELTLEMVTDEERDYMYRVFAHDPQARINLGIRRRLAPLLGKDRRRIELMNGLLFSLPGTPVIYYGDEIGMGDNIYLGDRNGVRTPMQWSADRNAGFSRANAQRLFLPVIIDPDFHYEAVNVEARQNNPHSILWWMKRLIALRKRYQAFGRGSLEFLLPENHKVLAFLRRYEGEQILVVANLSRFAQCVELDLAGHDASLRGLVPTELFGGTEFPVIREQPYLLTLGPHAFFWFSLQPQRVEEVVVEAPSPTEKLPVVRVSGAWENLFRRENRGRLDQLLPDHLRSRRWFGGKSQHIKTAQVVDAIPIEAPGGAETAGYLAVVQVEFAEGDPQTYVVTLAFATGERAAELLQEAPHSVLARMEVREKDQVREGILCGALREKAFNAALLEAVARRRHFKGAAGEVVALPARRFRRVRGEGDLEPALMRAEQSNTSVMFGDKLVMKLIRKLEDGVNPDLEMSLYLTEKAGFEHIPQVAGWMEYRRGAERERAGGARMTLGILQGFVPNQGDAWKTALDALSQFYEQALAHNATPAAEAAGPGEQPARAASEAAEPLPVTARPLELVDAAPPELLGEFIGAYRESARQLGERTAELHSALARATEADFAPEPFTLFLQRSLYQSMRNLASQTWQVLRRRMPALPEDARPAAQALLEREEAVRTRFRSLLDLKLTGLRTRIHGDYHLGQVLFTGKDFVIIDFEGEPARPLSQRRLKRSPLVDVAGMLRSFHYAAYAALLGRVAGGVIRTEDLPALEPWAEQWNLWVSAAYLRAYLEVAQKGEPAYLPQSREELAAVLDLFVLEKAVYELGYELNNRPAWVKIPMAGILRLLEPEA